MIATLLLAWLALLAAGGTPIGRTLRRWLVAVPAAMLARITRGQLLLGGMIFATVAMTLWLLGHDGLMLLGMAAPEMAGWLAMIDASMLADVALVTLVTASAVRWQALARWVAMRFVRRAPRARRAQRVRRTRPPANDGDRPAWAALAA